MATKTVQSVGSRPRKDAANVVLLPSPDGKIKESVSAQARRVMIAEAAYYISERRGFGAGREIEDWLLAEKQVNAILSGESAKPAS